VWALCDRPDGDRDGWSAPILGVVSLADPLRATPPPVKPRLRGWLHLWSFVIGIAAGATLVAVAGATVSAEAAVACAVYSVTVLGLFGISALYHRRTWTTVRSRTLMKRLDHAMIFVFIAGTYTPFAVLALPETTGLVVLGVVWAGALGGVVLKLWRPNAPRWVGVPFYLALGWVAVFVLPDLLARGGVAALVLLLVGGGFYSLGALCYAFRRPVGWPRTFGFHEFFHAATVVAAICHYIAIWLVVYA
jgi:hemolysin III